MYQRILKIPKSKSFFLFGARGTGKSTLLREAFPDTSAYRLDLLLPSVEDRLTRSPESLVREVQALPSHINTIVLDEVQKVPKLLDVVHHLLETSERKFRFILTGSSGRKLKKGSANLLGGRAFLRELFPLIQAEVGAKFSIDHALLWGTLPYVYSLEDDEEKRDYLTSYVRTYVQEEIQREQVVRNLDPFRRFLEVAAQYNGNITNYSNIAKGLGVDAKTVASYYSILDDTLLGHIVPPFDFSFRKALTKSPKFYFFDNGVCRAMARTLSVEATAGTSTYGELFEQCLGTQIIHTAKYRNPDVRISFYRDENDIEVDFVIERPGQPILFVEIKSATSITENMLKNLRTVRKDFPNAQFELWSQDPVPKNFDRIEALYWQEALMRVF